MREVRYRITKKKFLFEIDFLAFLIRDSIGLHITLSYTSKQDKTLQLSMKLASPTSNSVGITPLTTTLCVGNGYWGNFCSGKDEQGIELRKTSSMNRLYVQILNNMMITILTLEIILKRKVTLPLWKVHPT